MSGPEENWTLAINSEPELTRKVMDWLRTESLHDPVAHQLYSLMIVREIPILNVLFAMAQAKSSQAKQAIKKLIEFHQIHVTSHMLVGKGL
ncbi:MAG: hypothetical protein WC600_18150 [Desulfobaccales bacterium]